MAQSTRFVYSVRLCGFGRIGWCSFWLCACFCAFARFFCFVSYDLYGTKAPVRTRISGAVGRFAVTMPGDAAWLSILSDTWPARARANILWPCGLDEFDNRLNLTWINGTRTGRLR